MNSLMEALGSQHREKQIWAHSRRDDSLAEIHTSKRLARHALSSFEDIFDTFIDDESLARRIANSDPFDERPHFTNTTPFFTFRTGERIAVQQYFAERRISTPKESWLGRLGLARDITFDKDIEHYALVFDAGYGETRELARVKASLRENSYIGHYGEVPHQIAHENSGTVEQDQRAVTILDAMQAAIRVSTFNLDLMVPR